MEKEELLKNIDCVFDALALCVEELRKIVKMEIELEGSPRIDEKRKVVLKACVSRNQVLEEALKETIRDLEKTRRAFTSKQVDNILANLNLIIYNKT